MRARKIALRINLLVIGNHKRDMEYSELCKSIFELDPGVRFAGVCDYRENLDTGVREMV